MIQFVHTADIHFGVENYGKIDPKTGIHTRLLDFQKSLNFCIDTALEKKVDFFLFSGDAYKTTNPSPTQQKLLLKCLLRLYNARIPVVIVVGNHDNPLSFGKANTLDIFGELPLKGFHVIDKPKLITLNTHNGPINIVGIPWPTRNSIALSAVHKYKTGAQITEYIAKAVTSIVKDFAQRLDRKTPAVLAGHLTVSSGLFSGSEKRAIYGNDPLFLPSDLAIEPFDYIALGHLHRHQNLNPKGYPALVYSGSPERIDFGERKEKKGFCLVSIPEKDRASYQFIETPTRPFLQIEVKLQADERDQTDQILDSLQKYDITNTILKIIYHVPANKKDTVNLKIIERACNKSMYLVGIIPIRQAMKRQRRTMMKVSMNFKMLLSNYFETRPEFQKKKDALIEKALFLYEEALGGEEKTN